MISPIPGIPVRIRATDACIDRLTAILGIVLTRYSDAPSARSATLERCAKAERFGLVIESLHLPYGSRSGERLLYCQRRLSRLLYEDYRILARQMHPRITMALIRSLASDARLKTADLFHCRIVWALASLYHARTDQAHIELEAIFYRLGLRLTALRGVVSHRWF